MSHSRGQMHEGPWLDRLFPIHLPDGRVVSVLEFSVVPTNVGIMEGGLSPVANARQREIVLAIAEKRCGGPVVVIEPAIVPLTDPALGRVRERYPWMACIARLWSEPLDPEMFSSELTLVWWQDAFDAPLPVEVERAAAGLDWHRSAEDVGWP